MRDSKRKLKKLNTNNKNNNSAKLNSKIDSQWVGVDFDGTLAEYNKYEGVGVYGDAIPEMVAKVKLLLASGMKVKIFTARACNGGIEIANIQDWLVANNLPRLEVTNVKDFHMVELWDDRAVTVIPNTGLFFFEMNKVSNILSANNTIQNIQTTNQRIIIPGSSADINNIKDNIKGNT